MPRLVQALVIARPETSFRRLLLVGYFFPPQPKGGAHRLGHIAKHLPEFGWDVTVVTPTHHLKKVGMTNRGSSALTHWHEVGRQVLRHARLLRPIANALIRLYKFPHSLRNFPDSTVWWIKPALQEIDELFGRQPFDAVLTTHSPCSCHLIGAEVARRYRIPWVADYQDLWTYNGSSTKSSFRKLIEKQVEQQALKRASAITCCKESFVSRLDELQQTKGRKKVRVIPFAVDLDEWNSVPDVPPDDFRISFVGNMYPKHITPDVLFAALAKLREAGDPAGLEAEFHYYGSSHEIVLAAARRHGIEASVFIHGVVSRRSALEAERASALLVSVVNPDSHAPNPHVWFPSKLFEYAGAQRPILAIAPLRSIQQEFIRESGLGYFAFNVEGCVDAISQAHAKYKAGKSAIAPRCAWKFSTPREVAHQFTSTLNSVVLGKSPEIDKITDESGATDVDEHLLPSFTGAS